MAVRWTTGKPDTPRIMEDRYYAGPKSVMAGGSGGKGGISMPSGFKRTPTRLKMYNDLYSGENTISIAINQIASNACMTGYTLHGDEAAVERVREVLKGIDFENRLYENTIFGLVFGDSFVEIVDGKGENEYRLKTIDPRTMEVTYDEHGDITGFQQKMAGQVIADFKPEEVMQFGFLPIPGSPYHMSIIEPSVDVAKRKIRADEAISSAIDRHGVPKFHVTVDTTGELGYKGEHLPTKEVLEDIGSKFESLQHDNEIVTADIIKIEPIDAQGVENVKDYYYYFQSQLITGLMVPQEIMGLGDNSTEATAHVRQVFFERMIKTYQYKIARTVETQLFDMILDEPGQVRIKFRGTTEADEVKKSEWIARTIDGFAELTKAFKRSKGATPAEELPFTAGEVRVIVEHLLSLLISKEDMDEAMANVKEPENVEQPEEDEDIEEENENE